MHTARRVPIPNWGMSPSLEPYGVSALHAGGANRKQRLPWFAQQLDEVQVVSLLIKDNQYTGAKALLVSPNFRDKAGGLGVQGYSRVVRGFRPASNT